MSVVSTVPDLPMASSESVVSLAPFTVRRVARWAECDPAGVVYLGNFPDYLLSAVHLFREQVFGADWIESGGAMGYQAPGKALSMVFQSSLWPNDVFDMEVYVGDLRTRTMDILVQARRADDGADVFAGRVTSIFVSREDRRMAIAIPREVSDRMLAYRSQAPTAPALTELLRRP